MSCLLENSLVLTDHGYLAIQDLRNGYFLKTLRNGLQPIIMIGSKQINHIASEDRIIDQLYRCSMDDFSELSQDLILTGGYCLFVDNFIDNDQKLKIYEINGNVDMIDDKYRLPACAHPTISVYEIPGTYTVYSLCLEHQDYERCYGIYVNGLEVETCSKKVMMES